MLLSLWWGDTWRVIPLQITRTDGSGHSLMGGSHLLQELQRLAQSSRWVPPGGPCSVTSHPPPHSQQLSSPAVSDTPTRPRLPFCCWVSLIRAGWMRPSQPFVMRFLQLTLPIHIYWCIVELPKAPPHLSKARKWPLWMCLQGPVREGSSGRASSAFVSRPTLLLNSFPQD